MTKKELFSQFEFHIVNVVRAAIEFRKMADEDQDRKQLYEFGIASDHGKFWSLLTMYNHILAETYTNDHLPQLKKLRTAIETNCGIVNPFYNGIDIMITSLEYSLEKSSNS